MTDQALTIPQQAEQALKFAETRDKLLSLAAESGRITEITNTAGYQECHARRMVLKSTRIEIQKTGKDARDDAVKYQKAIIAKEKELIDIIEPEERRLQDLQDAVDQAKEREKQAKEQAERDRVAAINDRFVELRGLPLKAVNAAADDILLVIEEAEAVDPETFPEDMRPAAVYEKRLAITALRAALDRRIAEDAEAVKIQAEREELERLRAEADAVRAEAARMAAEQADRERLANEDRIRQEASEAAEKASAHQIADAKRQAEEAEQRGREAAEKARRDEEERVRKEQEKREANRKHCAAVNNKAMEALVKGGIDEAAAKTAVTLIASGKVPAVTIAY